MTTARIRALAAPAAFSLLALLLAGLGMIPTTEALWTIVAVVLAFGPTGWISPSGLRRWSAEALLLPTAFVMTLMAEPSMRRMLVPPLVMLAAWAALSAARRRKPDARADAALIGVFGLAVRASIGVSLAAAGWQAAIPTLAASTLIPFAFGLVAPIAGVLAVLLISILPLQQAPPVGVGLSLAAAVVVVLLLLARRRGTSFRWTRIIEESLHGWLPAFGGISLVGLALGSWGSLPLSSALPDSTWVSWVGLGVVLVVTLRLYPAAAGATTVLVCLLFGGALPPAPEGRAVILSPERAEAWLRVGTGGPYEVHASLGNGMKVEQGQVVAWVHIGSKKNVLRAGEEIAEAAVARATTEKPSAHTLPTRAIWRPPPEPGLTWRVVGRSEIEVPKGVGPVIERNPALEDKVRVIVSAAGPTRPVGPRAIAAENWLWLTAALLALLQLVSGTWARRWAWPGWMLLVAGMVVSRMSVEPLHLLLERHCVDLCLAVVLVSWTPAALGWLRKGRSARAAAWLLIPLALATPNLTPPLWGDEPFHLALMESLVEDGDLDLENNLSGGGETAELILGSDNFFHSPAYGFFLAPAYRIGGRAGVLVVLALGGALIVAFILRRLRRWLDPPRWVVTLVFFGCLLSYPLATFATQVWPGIVGMVTVAAILVLVSREEIRPNASGEISALRRWGAAALAFTAVAVKTRFALLVFPIAAAAWWRPGRKKVSWQALLCLGGAAVAALVVGWLTMGHPFGPFRRLHHLIPGDLGLPFRVVGGLLFDGAGGLAWTAPLWLLGIFVMPALWRRGGPGERALVLGGAATVVFLLHSTEWYGGGSPPARYLVILLPGIWLALGLLLASGNPLRRIALVLFPPSLLGWWVLATRPHFSVNPGDGSWWFTNALSRRFAADAAALFPSFLAPSAATVVTSGLLILVTASLWWLTRSAWRARTLFRLTTALWLVAAGALVAAVDLRTDTVVEVEAAQVRRHGGEPIPPEGTAERYSHLNGRRLGSGNGLTIPLRMAAGARPFLVCRVDGPAAKTFLDVRWNDGEVERVELASKSEPDGVYLPAPPGVGRQWINIVFAGSSRSSLVADKVVIHRD